MSQYRIAEFRIIKELERISKTELDKRFNCCYHSVNDKIVCGGANDELWFND